MRPSYLTADGNYDRAAIMREAHRRVADARTWKPGGVSLASQLRAVWYVARKSHRAQLLDRLAGHEHGHITRAFLSLLPTDELRRRAA